MNRIADFPEDKLPPGQDPIKTKSYRRFQKLMRIFVNTRADTGYPTIAVVTGPAGSGKTIAVATSVGSQEPRSHTGLPPVIKVTMVPDGTVRTLAVSIKRQLTARPASDDTGLRSIRGNRYELADEAIEAIKRNDIVAVLVDEADRLNESDFELLRYIHDESGCGIGLIGLPELWRVIGYHEKFKSRVGLKMNFDPPSEGEILQVILPKIVIPGWQYDFSIPDDRAMGELIVSKTHRSFEE